MKCKDCGKEMLDPKTKSCTQPLLVVVDPDSDSGLAIVYDRDTTYFDVNERCHDCGIVNKSGNIHHFGCDIECCPKCGGQLISCGCFDGATYYVGSKGKKQS